MPIDEHIHRLRWPNLLKDGGVEKSPRTVINRDYNCVAFAAGKEDAIWWPGLWECYWPLDSEEETLENFQNAFRLERYEPCEDGKLENGFEKIAFYGNEDGIQHAAKQLPDGRWKSKLGDDLEDIEHNTLWGLEGRFYGNAIAFMKRPISES